MVTEVVHVGVRLAEAATSFKKTLEPAHFSGLLRRGKKIFILHNLEILMG